MASMPALQAVSSGAAHDLPRAGDSSRLALAGRRTAVRREKRSFRIVTPGERRWTLLAVALAHAAGILLLSQAVRPTASEAPPTITAVLIELPKALPVAAPPAPPQRQPEKPAPRPKPVVQPKPRPAPLPRTESATALSAPPAAEAPAPAETRPAAPPEPTPPAPPAKPGPAAAPAATPARFDAAYLNNPAPAYPRLSHRMREEGKVMLRVQVTAEGLAAKVELAESSGSGRLDQAAREAVLRWRFVPAKQDGHAVEAWVVVPIIFKLEGN